MTQLSQAVLDSIDSSEGSIDELSDDYEFIQGAKILAQVKYGCLSDAGKYKL